MVILKKETIFTSNKRPGECCPVDTVRPHSVSVNQWEVLVAIVSRDSPFIKRCLIKEPDVLSTCQ